MQQPTRSGRVAVVLGGRGLGRAIIESLVADGWSVTGVARSPSTLEGVAAAGARAMAADVTDPESVRGVLTEAAAGGGRVDLVVNAASPYGGVGPFGGGPIAEAAPDAFDAWAAAPARGAYVFLSAAGRFALEQGGPATLIQVTGGSSRRAMPGKGLWAAGCFGVRAITQAAAQEMRPHGVHCALLVVDAVIAPMEGAPPAWADPASLADPRRLTDAVRFLADQDASAVTHELQLTPLGETWVP